MNGQVAEMKEAMEYLKMGKLTVCKLVCEGRFPAHKVGCEWRFNSEKLNYRLKSGISALRAEKTHDQPH